MSILSMLAASTMYGDNNSDNSHAPIMQINVSRISTSGLRNSDVGDDEEYDEFMMQQPMQSRRDDGHF
jgi:hypothetical protein